MIYFDLAHQTSTNRELLDGSREFFEKYANPVSDDPELSRSQVNRSKSNDNDSSSLVKKLLLRSFRLKCRTLSSHLNYSKMSAFQLPLVDSLPALSTTERAAVLDALFEPCTALHTLSVELLQTETFPSYFDLIASVGVQLTDLSESPSTSDTEWLDKILGAHPRLGEKKVESAQSQAEQAQLNTGGEEEAAKLRNLNDEYEQAFPGLKYV